MVNFEKIERIISEVNELEENEKLIFFQKIGELFNNDIFNDGIHDIDDKQHEEVSIESAFGLWKGRNITKEVLRRNAWMKK